MKEKLELNHIYGYLIYGLDAWIDGVICEIEGVDLHFENTVISERVNYKLSEIIPILRPMSDLLKEIEIKGKKFVPKDVLDETHISHWSYENIKRLSIIEVQQNAPFWFTNKLIEWHFDIYGLIEKGLAIDINTIKKDVL